MTLHLDTDRALLSRHGPSTRYLIIQLLAPSGSGGPRPPVSVSLVLDRSGSMGGGKFDLARRAVVHALTLLEPRDSFSVVVFDDRIETVMPQSSAHPEARAEAGRRLQAIHPRGSTDLCTGWLTGCGEVAQNVIGEVIGRTLLLTDGLANKGDTDPAILTGRAADLRKRGVSTSTFGVGADFDESLLGRMADAGGGAFHFIADAQRIPTMMATELGETLEVVARDVVLNVTLPANVVATPIGTWEKQPTPDGFRVSLPDVVARQSLEIVARLDLPPAEDKPRIGVRVTVQDRGGALGNATAEVYWYYAEDTAVNAQRIDDGLARLVIDKESSFAREEALLLNKLGRMREARDRMRKSAEVLSSMGAQSVVAQEASDDMSRESERLGQRMDAMDLKREHYAASQVSRGFDPAGRRKKQQ